MSLNYKIANGARWSFLEKGGQQIAGFIVFMVVARLIGPEQYGIVSLCYVYLAVTTPITSNLVDGIISLQIRDNIRLSTLFWSLCCIGLALTILGALAAYPIAHAMNLPELAPLLLWFSLLPIPLALAAVPTALVYAEINFKSLALRTLFSTVTGGIIGIVMAIKGFGAYAIVAQQLTQFFLTSIIIWWVCPWRPQFCFAANELIYTTAPGLKLMISNFINAITYHTPRYIIGFLLGPISVGLFAFVMRIVLAVLELIFSPVTNVISPALASIPDDKEEQKRILSTIIRLIGFLGMPIIGGGIITAPIFIPLFFGIDWIAGVPLLQVCLMTVGTWSLINLLKEYFRSQNLMAAYNKNNLWISLLHIATITGLIFHSLFAAMCGYLAIGLLSLVVYTNLARKETGLSFWPNYLGLWPALVSTLLMQGVMYTFINSIATPNSQWLLLGVSILLGGGVYFTAIFLMRKNEIKGLIKLIIKNRSKQN